MVTGHPEVGGYQGPAGHSCGRSAGQSGASDGRRIDHADISTREVMRQSIKSMILLHAQQKLKSVCGATHWIGGPESDAQRLAGRSTMMCCAHHTQLCSTQLIQGLPACKNNCSRATLLRSLPALHAGRRYSRRQRCRGCCRPRSRCSC